MINKWKNVLRRASEAVSLLGIQLSDFSGEELVYALIHPSHEAILLPLLTWSTVDMLEKGDGRQR